MCPTLESLGIDKLSVEERIDLAEAIRDNVAEEIEKTPLSEDQKREIDRRLANHRANPSAARSWDEVEAELLARLSGVLHLPVPRPTRCAFVGPDLALLAVTSARMGLSDAEFEAAPLSGQVLLVNPDGPRGLPTPRFAGRCEWTAGCPRRPVCALVWV